MFFKKLENIADHLARTVNIYQGCTNSDITNYFISTTKKREFYLNFSLLFLFLCDVCCDGKAFLF